ncbi:hypothetical protein [Streptomyces cyaneofuscatus]|uniref:hypothetical protein n=1 Tax=Streptomyces cyaneofuscatus TaxID=66883 RepID=UPI0033B27AF6
MNDAFTLLRQAADLLPEEAVAESGWTAEDVREDIVSSEWERALDALTEIGDVHPVSVDFWERLAEAARQMMLDRSRRWCEWRAWETRARHHPGHSHPGGCGGGAAPDGLLRRRPAPADVGRRQPECRR